MGDVGLLSAVVRGTASVAVGTMAGAAGAALGVGAALVSPVVEVGRGVVEGALTAAGGSASAPRVVWRAGGRVHVDVRSVLGSARGSSGVRAVEAVAGSVPGVVGAHVEPALGRLVVVAQREDHAEELGRRVVQALQQRRERGGGDLLGDGRGSDWSLRVTVPGAGWSVAVPVVAAAMDAAAVAGALVGQLGRLPAVPRAARAAVAVVRHQPRLVALLEARLGRVGTDMVLTAATAAVHGLGQAPGVPLLDLAQRIGQVGEMLAHRQAWAVWEPVLTAARRPRLDPGMSRRLWALSNGSPPAAPLSSGVTQADAGGEIESYLQQAASGSLVAAAGAVLAGGDQDDIAGAVLAGVPKAAQLGGEAFATVFGRGVAQAGMLVLDPDVLRRFDRVAVVLVDGAALRGDHRMVLGADGQAPGWDADRVYEVADALLHGETAPDPDPDEAAATGAQLRPIPPARPDAPAEGRQHAQLVVAEQVVGTVQVGWEPDAYALALVETARRSGVRVVLRHVAGTTELATSVAETYPAGTGLLELVHTLRGEHGPVLLVSSLHPDCASEDTLAALAAADVSIALDDPRAAAPWTADIITSPELAQAVRLLSALPGARRTTAAAVRLAKAGSTLEGLLLTTRGSAPGSGWLGLRCWFSPVNTTAAIAQMVGAVHARAVLGLPDPDPVPLTAWHALDAEIVFTRLTGGPTPLASPATTPRWRRRLTELREHPRVAPLDDAAHSIARLANATRHELSDPLTPVLAVGAVASAILGSGTDAVLVASVMVVNALVGGVQRLRADNALAALFTEQDQLARRVVIPALGSTHRRLRAARDTTRTQTIPTHRLRPGDVIELHPAEVVPADARLLTATDLEVDESSLTGESLPVTKQTDPVPGTALGERTSMVFEGATIVAGTARAVVVATGSATAARRAIASVADLAPAVGVAARLGELTSKVLPLTLAGGAAVTGISLLNGQPLAQAVADGVAIAVAAVPEGLPLVATVAQLAAARRLSGRGVLVRAPRAIEALGRVDTICFDKTGTLTENKLRVTTAVTPDWDPHSPPPRLSSPDAAMVLRTAARACPPPTDGHGHAHATDEAVLTADSQAGPDTTWTAMAQVPFESSRGYASTVGIDTTSTTKRASHDDAPPEQRALVVKGAPEIVLDRCSLTPEARTHARVLTEHLAGQGLRVLAIAHRTLSADELPQITPGHHTQTTASHAHPKTDSDDETTIDDIDRAVHAMHLVGFVGIADTLRASATTLVTQLVEADRAVVLITGDHPVTATAIATQLGLPGDSPVVTGADLAALDEAGRADLARHGRIFARVSPEQKVQVIQALQQAGRVCAMVGDGANDAAAIRMATVGIGVSSRGSSAARGAADLVITDDDLTVLLDALAEGRNMWASVRDAVVILLGGNAGEVAFTITGTTLGGRAPISTRQLLLVNLLTDMFPALAVAITPQQCAPATGEQPAARQTRRHALLTAPAPSLDRPLITAITARGAATTAGATLAWGIGTLTPGTHRRSATMGLTALVGTQLTQTLLTRRHSPLVLATSIGSAAALIAIVQTPGLSHFFGCTPLGPVAWAGVLTATGLATLSSALTPTQLTST
jgi:cation-transporting ATPase I